MIKTAIDVVRSIRKEKNPDFFDEHDNRYCISVRENDLMVSYMFSTPIRREKTNKVVDLKWHKKGNAWETFGAAEGSTIIVTSAHVIITKTRMQYKLYFPFENDWKNEEQELRSDCISIVPTTNGIMVSVNCTGTSITKFTLESRNIKDGVQKNTI